MTPDTPLSDLTLDEPSRPKMPPLPQVTEAQRQKGGHLGAIHNGYRRDLTRIAQVMERIEKGDEAPEALHRIILSLEMAENFRAFGTMCGQGCKILQFHHAMEESHMFPGLEAPAHAALTAVVTRLREEHAVVHALLTKLERAAMALMYDPDEASFAKAAEIFRRLDAVIRSHFSYEETELVEPIGVYLDGI